MSKSQQKVIVIGAGIIGLTTALELVEQGFKVQIIDQGQAARESSWAGAGILSPMYPWNYHPAINQLARYGKDRYQQWNQKLQPATGIDFQIETTGMLIFDEQQFECGLAYADRFHEPQQQAKQVCRLEIEQINAHVSTVMRQAMYFPHLAHIRNPRLTQSLVNYLRSHADVELYENRQICTFKMQGERVLAAIDSQQQCYYADHFVIASGAWSEVLLTQFELSCDIQPVHGQMLLFKAPAAWLTTMCMHQGMYLIPRRDGHILCGSSTQFAGFTKHVDANISSTLKEFAYSLVPDLKQWPILQQWAGLRPCTADQLPKICRIPTMQNIWLNVGHYRNGLVMAPASARLLRQLMLEQDPFVDPSSYAI